MQILRRPMRFCAMQPNPSSIGVPRCGQSVAVAVANLDGDVGFQAEVLDERQRACIHHRDTNTTSTLEQDPSIKRIQHS